MEKSTFQGRFWKETLMKSDTGFQVFCHWEICKTRLRKPPGLTLGVVKFPGNVKFKFRIFSNSNGKRVRLIAFCLTPELLENVIIENVDSDFYCPEDDYQDASYSISPPPNNLRIKTDWWVIFDNKNTFFCHVRCLIRGTFKKPSLDSISKISLNKDLVGLRDYFDLKICCQDYIVHTHKAILAARSPVFNRMIQSNQMKESKNGVLEIKDSSPNTVKAMVDFIYTDHLEEKVEESKLEDLLKMGEKYDIKSLRVACQLKLIEMLGEEAALDKLEKNKCYGSDELIEMAANIVKSSLK